MTRPNDEMPPESFLPDSTFTPEDAIQWLRAKHRRHGEVEDGQCAELIESLWYEPRTGLAKPAADFFGGRQRVAKLQHELAYLRLGMKEVLGRMEGLLDGRVAVTAPTEPDSNTVYWHTAYWRAKAKSAEAALAAPVPVTDEMADEAVERWFALGATDGDDFRARMRAALEAALAKAGGQP